MNKIYYAMPMIGYNSMSFTGLVWRIFGIGWY